MSQKTWTDIEREEYGEQTLVKCPDCQQTFIATPDNEKFCSRCNAIFEISFEE